MRIAIALVVAFAVGPTAVAGAQPPSADLPDDASAVAGPTTSGARLYVWDEGRSLCASAVGPNDRFAGTRCGPPPDELRHPTVSTDDLGPGRHRVWGIVDPEVASVEVVLTGGRRLSAPTSTGDRYRGSRAGSVRFFLIEARWPRSEYPLYLRLLSADGSLLGTAEAGTDQDGRARHPVVVARGTLGGARWRVRASTRPALAPLPGDEERVVTRRCLEFKVLSGSRFTQSIDSTCDDPDFDRRPVIEVSRTCGPIGVRATGLLPRGARVLAVLGDGRRIRPRLISLPRRFGPVRAFVLPLRPHVALRALATFEGGRREVPIGGIGPGLADCPDTSSGYLFGFGLGMPRFGSGPPALQLRDDDEGVLLCATLGLPDPSGYDCGRPPLDADQSWVLHRITPESTTVAGVVTPEVASVEVLFAGGGSQLVPTMAGAYPGRYRDLVRVFSVAVPGEQRPRAARLIGADGGRLASVRIYTAPEFLRPPQPVLRSPGGWRVAAGVLAETGGRRYACLQLTRGEPSDDPAHCGLAFGRAKQARVTCGPRRTLVYGGLKEGEDRVQVTTTEGTVGARTASLRRLGTSGRAFLAELPAGAGLRAVIVHGDRVRNLHKRLPPASRQCGYEEPVSFR